GGAGAAGVHGSLGGPASRAIVSQSSAVVARPAASRARPRLPGPAGLAKAPHGLDRMVDLLLAVRERDEHALELTRRDVDAVGEQMAEERAVAFRIRALRVVEVAHGRVGHEERGHRADALHPAVRLAPPPAPPPPSFHN